MQPTHKTRNQIVRPSFKGTKANAWSSTRNQMSTYIVDEIRAYGVIRDLALAEAERVPNSLNLQRVRIANDFVANALKPARPSYQSQHLPEDDAARERERCKAVRFRISHLKTHLAARSHEHVQAA
jgi:hypothetical protein